MTKRVMKKIRRPSWILGTELPTMPEKVRRPNPGSIQDLQQFCRRLLRTTKGDDRTRLRIIENYLEEREAIGHYELAMAFQRMSSFKAIGTRPKTRRRK